MNCKYCRPSYKETNRVSGWSDNANCLVCRHCLYVCMYVCMYIYMYLITLDNKSQNIFCICNEYVINLFICIYEVRKGT